MKISPVFSAFNCNKPCSGNNINKEFSGINFNRAIKASTSDDVFVRLADASFRDAKIANELKSMGLI